MGAVGRVTQSHSLALRGSGGMFGGVLRQFVGWIAIYALVLHAVLAGAVGCR